MLRKSLIMMALVTTFTMNVNAVQIKVPEGQPPVPGADASIPANAYENYRAGSLSNLGTSTVIKMHSAEKDYGDKLVTEGKVSREQANKFVERRGRQSDIVVNQSTVMLLHDERNNIRASFPAIVLEGYYYPKRSNGERFSVVGEKDTFFGIGTNRNYDDAWARLKSSKKGKFKYPGITHGKWAVEDESLGENYPAMSAIFELDNQPNQEYIIGIGYNNQPITDKMERVMSNFVIPSIRSLDDLDNYSESITWNNLMYRIPKGLTLKGQKNLKDFAEAREYHGSGVLLVVTRKPVKVDDKYSYSFFNEIKAVKAERPFSIETPVQSATVWNNGIPSFLVDHYQPGKKSVMYRFLRDDKNIYIMVLLYRDGIAPYSHIQIRNTLEYSDFVNIESLRNKPVSVKW